MYFSLSPAKAPSLSRRACLVAGALLVAAGGLAACGETVSKDTSQEKAEAVATQVQETKAEVSEAAKDLKVDNHTIVFEVSSSTATKADITITSLDANGSLTQEQKANEDLPFTKTIEVDGSVVFDFSNANMLVQAKDGEDITATIKIDDQEPVTSTGSGPFATTVVQGASK